MPCFIEQFAVISGESIFMVLRGRETYRRMKIDGAFSPIGPKFNLSVPKQLTLYVPPALDIRYLVDRWTG